MQLSDVQHILDQTMYYDMKYHIVVSGPSTNIGVTLIF